MPGPVLTQTATVLCVHGGQAQPTTPLPRLLLSGTAAVGQTPPYVVTGCVFNVSGAPSPCVTGTWVVAAVRVRSTGIPLLLQDSVAVCAPNGTPLTIASPGQVRVTAQ